MLPKILPRFKHSKSEEDYKNVTCANCETKFDGHFCPNCGQSVKEFDKPISFVLYNFLGDFFAFDTRFFKTFIALLFRPGFLSKEYIEGRRVRYAPPFRVYVFVSFVLFLLLQIYTNKGLVTVLDSEKTKVGLDSSSVVMADSVLNTVSVEMAASEMAETDSLLNQIGIKVDTTKLYGEGRAGVDLAELFKENSVRSILDNSINKLEEELKTEEDPAERADIQKYLRILRSPEQTNANILKYISWAFFLLLPLLAVILKLVYIRRKQNYMRHLVFSIHIHSFIFVVMILIVGLFMLFGTSIINIVSFLLLVTPIYLIIAMWKFYGQSIGKTIIKFITVSFIYNVIFMIVIFTAALKALNLG
ncbi:DUF3667 domain-containing protein [uncultured Draconibacterium sp.]|uniref:DUF3667 domain-containing protein n=1 Tax=uncultured Draconibacterium sp. TaxID=1573823 RepID=UPI0032172223